MKFTNVSNLPPAVMNLLTSQAYEPKGDTSVTRLIKPPRIVALQKRHHDKIVQDAQQYSWSLLGSAVHAMLQGSAGDGVIVEKRLHTEIFGWDVNGQPDIYYPDTRIEHDYKVTSVWAFIFADKPEWEQQLNLNAMLHRLHGQPVEQIAIIAILRDWQQRKAETERDYPQHAIHVVGQPVWDQDQCIDFAEQRVALHQDAQKLPDDELPLCMEKERWFRTGGFPVMKNNNKRADRVYDTQGEATKHIERETINLKKGRFFMPVVERPGENIRCIRYCDVAEFCPFGRAEKAKHEAERIKPVSAPKFAGDDGSADPEGEGPGWDAHKDN